MLSNALSLTLLSLLGLALAQEGDSTPTASALSSDPTPSSMPMPMPYSPPQEGNNDHVQAPTNRGPHRMPGGSERLRAGAVIVENAWNSTMNSTDGDAPHRHHNYTLGFNMTASWNATCNGTTFTGGDYGNGTHSMGNWTMDNGPICNGTDLNNGTGPPPPPPKPFSMKCKVGQVGTFLMGEADGKGKCVNCAPGDASCTAVGNNTRQVKAATCASTYFLHNVTGNCHTCNVGYGNVANNTASDCTVCDSKYSSACTFILTARDDTCIANSYLKSKLCTPVASGEWTPPHNKLTTPNKCPKGAKACTSKTKITTCLANYKQGVDSKKAVTCTKLA